VPFELQLYHKHPTLEYRILGCFVGPGKPLRRNWKIFHWCTHVESDSRLRFQKWSKSVQGKWPKGRVSLTKNKTRFGTLGRNPWGISPIFSCVIAHRGPSLIFQIPSAIPHRFRFGEVITEKHVHETQSKCNIASSS